VKEPFEGDKMLEGIVNGLVKSLNIDCVIETGTETGATANWFAARVPKVYTCDVDDLVDRELLDNVSYSLCASYRMLDNLLPTQAHNYRRILFWLDAHNEPTNNPLPRELHLIAVHRVQDPVICIHDYRVPNHPELGFDTFEGFGPLSLETVEDKMHDIFPNGFNVHHNSEATGAKRGVGFFIGR